MTIYRVRPFDTLIDVAAFQCGKPALDEYIRRYASQDVRRNLARTYAAAPEDRPATLAGYYTLSASSVDCSNLPAEQAKKLPQYPIPVALIGRLAVDSRFQGQGLGSILMGSVFDKVSRAREVLAVAGIAVLAKDQEAKDFYMHFGIEPMRDHPNRLFLPSSGFMK